MNCHKAAACDDPTQVDSDVTSLWGAPGSGTLPAKGQALALALQGAEVRKAMDALRSTEELYFEHFLAAPLPILRIDAEGLIREANLRGIAFLNVEPGEWNCRPIPLVSGLSEADQQRWAEFLISMRKSGTDQQVRLELTSGSNEATPFRIYGRRIETRAGAPEGECIVYIQNVSEEENALGEVLRLSQIAKHTDSGIIFTDTDRKITHANEGFVRISGYSVEEVIGRNPSFLQGPETDPECVARIRSGLNARETVVENILNYSKEGEKYWVRLEIHPYHDRDGVFTGFFSVQTDLTDILARRESHAALQTAIEHSPSTVVVTDLNASIIYANPAFEKITGYSIDEVRGKKTSILKSGEQDRAFYDGLWATLNADEPWEGLFHNRRKDGALYWEQATIAPIFDHRGEKFGYIAVKQDMTARKEAELALEAANRRLVQSETYARELARRANVASRAKTGFLANMSHEIRTPLNGVIGLSELLLDSNLTAEQRAWVEAIHTSGDTLLGILNDILDLSKIESGKMELRDNAFNLRETVETVRALMEPNTSHLGLAFNVDLAPDLPTHLRGDPLRLKQILTNLIGNSIKFTKEGWIRLRVESEPSAAGKALLRFSIIDTGIGVPPDRQDIIFDEFIQAESNLLRNPGGTGLGLAICKRLATLMGGEIELTSPVDVGNPEAPGTKVSFTAAFTIDARAANAGSDVDANQPTEGRTARRRMNALVVEDNLTNWTVAQLMLGRMGFNCTLALDGPKALNLLQHQRFELVCMDVRIPEINGCEVTRRLRASKDFATPANVPVIAITAGAREEDRAECLAAGMDEHLSKPISLKGLQEKIEGLFRVSV